MKCISIWMDYAVQHPHGWKSPEAHGHMGKQLQVFSKAWPLKKKRKEKNMLWPMNFSYIEPSAARKENQAAVTRVI